MRTTQSLIQSGTASGTVSFCKELYSAQRERIQPRWFESAGLYEVRTNGKAVPLQVEGVSVSYCDSFMVYERRKFSL